MTLRPRLPRQTPKIFSAYDLEWHPKTQKFRMAGVFDGKDYRCYATMGEFLTKELVPANFGRIFYAHNGGKSDLHFVLHELMSTGLCSTGGTFELDCSFNGSSAFLCHIRMRDNPKMGFTFGDTLFLLKASLKKIGQWIGFEKMEFSDFATEDWNLLRKYNEIDCRVLYKAVSDLEAELFEMRGELKLTLASSAMALFTTAYLKGVLETDRAVNAMTRKGYYASRVEVFTRECERALYYDVNSSFPWSMMQALPGKFLGRREGYTQKPKGGKLAMVEATVEIKDCYLPPAPFRDEDERILFPTGKWRGVFTDVDLRLIEQEGHIVHQVHWADWFEEFRDLGDYVRDIYAKKQTAEGFKREVYKLLLNSLYGKFAETETKKKLMVHPIDLTCPHKPRHKNRECWVALPMLGLYTLEETKALQHVHVPISAFVTAYSRGLLYRCLKRCKKIYYCDSISGGRTVVVKSPEGRVVIVPVEELWEKVRWVEGRGQPSYQDGGKEFVSPVGWSALAMDESGAEGWFPLKRVIRHKVKKDLWLLSTEYGQTEVTEDHGIMVSPREAVTPAKFLLDRSKFVKLKAPKSSRSDETLDLSEFCDVELAGVGRYYPSESPEMVSLLERVGRYVSEKELLLTKEGQVLSILCGSIYENVRLPEFVYDLSPKDAQVLWDSIASPDGSFVTSSQRLAAGLSYLLDQIEVEHAFGWNSDKRWTLKTGVLPDDGESAYRQKSSSEAEWVYDLSVDGAHTFVDGIGRVLLHNTDSIVCGETDTFPNALSKEAIVGFVGEEVGQLKLEQIIKSGHFAAPKLYMLEAREPSKADAERSPLDWWQGREQDNKTIVKSKGFSKLDGTSYLQLVSGEAVTLKRMSGIKENIRSGNMVPREVEVAKWARFKRTKRADDGKNGETRPWTITELSGGRV
ncbi:MAG: DNA polymerase [Candidatus Cryosericum sp.]